MDDPFDLRRFLVAQESVYKTALLEIQAGRKTSHWMWFVFPQLSGLGSSPISKRYAIRSLGEARAYLEHPVLGPRLIECCRAVLQATGKTATDIFGSPDDLKLRSSATLFALVSPPDSVFHRVLETFFAGKPDDRTVDLVRTASGGQA